MDGRNRSDSEKVRRRAEHTTGPIREIVIRGPADSASEPVRAVRQGLGFGFRNVLWKPWRPILGKKGLAKEARADQVDLATWKTFSRSLGI
ncbi:hypothetical protein RJ641_028646 [Dillenia turbinata]|uniref:Uncharacterized protein n=1 Tax=Dillenia turbinata TaxID=194707 RepID=A0AAN8VZL7_9MAGN